MVLPGYNHNLGLSYMSLEKPLDSKLEAEASGKS